MWDDTLHFTFFTPIRILWEEVISMTKPTAIFFFSKQFGDVISSTIPASDRDRYPRLPYTGEVSPKPQKSQVIFRSREADGSLSCLQAPMPTIQPIWTAPYRRRTNSRTCFHPSPFSNVTSFTAGRLPHYCPRQGRGPPGNKLLSFSSLVECTNFICLGQRIWPFHS